MAEVEGWLFRMGITQKLPDLGFAESDVTKLEGLVHGEVEDVGDRQAVVLHGQGGLVEALALALVTGDVDVGQEVHLDLDRPITRADLTSTTGHVEREPAGLVAANLGLRQVGKQTANIRKDPGVGCRVGARCAANRRLVDFNDLINMFQAFDFPVGHGLLS